MSVAGIPANSINLFNPRERNLSGGEVKAMRRLTPFASLPYWRWWIDGHVVPHFQDELSKSQ